MSALDPQREKFALEYLKHGNGTKAALAAGYAEKSAHVQASALLRNPKVRAFIDERQRKRLARYDVTAENVLRELSLLAFSRFEELLDLSDPANPKVALDKATPEQLAALSEVTITENAQGRRLKVKTHSKDAALNTLAKHLKLLVERVEVTNLEGFAEELRAGRERAARRGAGGEDDDGTEGS